MSVDSKRNTALRKKAKWVDEGIVESRRREMEFLTEAGWSYTKDTNHYGCSHPRDGTIVSSHLAHAMMLTRYWITKGLYS